MVKGSVSSTNSLKQKFIEIMANVIIGIHGLGNKPPKALLEQWWEISMIEGLRASEFNPSLTKFEMVYWADIIYDNPLNELEEDEDSPYFLKEKYTEAPENFVIEDRSRRLSIVDFLSRQLNRIFLNDDLTLNYTFITDAIVHNFFKDLEIYYAETCTMENGQVLPMHDLIRERLVTKLKEHKDDNIMLISHSMGSIIAFDVLSFMAPDIRINTFITMGSPLGLPVVISKIAAEQKQMGNINNLMTTPSGISGNWFNFSDILDKVAFNYKLSDDFSENSFGVKPTDYLVVNNYKSNGIYNPHKSYGYLRTPKFSRILNDFISSEKPTCTEKLLSWMNRLINYIRSLFKLTKRTFNQP